jgi:mRNA interferase MazF
VVAREYIPDAGDIVWIDFTPQTGHEQAGRRPALVLSPKIYNEKAGLAVMCPITSRVKGYAFEVGVSQSGPIKGVVLTDQLKSLDWRQRKAQRAATVSQTVLNEVRNRIAALLGIS